MYPRSNYGGVIFKVSCNLAPGSALATSYQAKNISSMKEFRKHSLFSDQIIDGLHTAKSWVQMF